MLLLVLAGSEMRVPSYQWDEVHFSNGSTAGTFQPTGKQQWASTLTHDLPIYVSVTTISSRLDKACDFFQTLFSGHLIPTHSYLFISREPWLMDQGISDSTLHENARVQQLMRQLPGGLLTIVFTNNLGPHRKLLPLLARKWSEDCLIVTFDDESGRRLTHLEGPDKLFSQLLRYYRLSDKRSIVALKVRRIGMCDVFPHFVLTYHPWWGQTTSGRHEMLVLPTGTGGVMYRPRFFHPVVFDPQLGNMTLVGDDLAFRLATMINNVKVVVGCHPMQQRYLGTPPCPKIHDVVLFQHGELELNSSSSSHRAGGRGRNVTTSPPSTPESVFGPLDTLHEGELHTRAAGSNGTSWLLSSGPHRRLADGLPADLEEMEREHVSPLEGHAHAGGKHQSLWGVNRLGGNDKQWKLATDYLQALRLFNMSDLVHAHLYSERASCFGLPFTQPGFVGRPVGLQANFVAVQPYRGRARQCQLKTCKSYASKSKAHSFVVKGIDFK